MYIDDLCTGVVELTPEEQKEIRGGWAWFLGGVALGVLDVAYDEVEKAWTEEINTDRVVANVAKGARGAGRGKSRH